MEALAAAIELISAGDVDRMLVVAADDDGSATRCWLETCAADLSYQPGAVALQVAPAGPAKAVVAL